MKTDFISVVEMKEYPHNTAQKMVREELFTMKQDVVQFMDTGLNQEDARVAQATREAIRAAEVILDKLFA